VYALRAHDSLQPEGEEAEVNVHHEAGRVYITATPEEAGRLSAAMVLAVQLATLGRAGVELMDDEHKYVTTVAVATVAGYATLQEVEEHGSDEFCERGTAGIRQLSQWGAELATAALAEKEEEL
jgi:hypothetical protein